MVTCWKEPRLDDRMQFAIFQKEKCPTTGKEHFQGYIEFKEKTSYKLCKEIVEDDKCHIEPRKGTQRQAIDYCSKVETRIGLPKVFGEPKRQGNRSDLDSILEAIQSGMTSTEILEEYGGHALRHINMINKGMDSYWGANNVDNHIRRCRTLIGRRILPPFASGGNDNHFNGLGNRIINTALIVAPRSGDESGIALSSDTTDVSATSSKSPDGL